MSTRPEEARGGGRARLVRLLVGAVALILVIAFAVANRQRVEIDYLFGSSDWRLIWVILAAAVLGSIATLVVQRRRR